MAQIDQCASVDSDALRSHHHERQ